MMKATKLFVILLSVGLAVSCAIKSDLGLHRDALSGGGETNSSDNAITLAERAKGADPFGYSAELLNLMRLAKNAPALPGQLAK
jgi:hypothetical protein